MTEKQFYKFLDKGLFKKSVLADIIGVCYPTILRRSKSKDFKNTELLALKAAGIISSNES